MLTTGNPVYRRPFDLWPKIYAISVDMGVLSRIAMAFQFNTTGTCLANQSDSAAALSQSLKFQSWGGGLVVFPGMPIYAGSFPDLCRQAGKVAHGIGLMAVDHHLVDGR